MLKINAAMLLGSLVLAACSSPQSKAEEADEAQHEANEKAARAAEETKLEADAIQKKADEESAQNSREGARKGQEAQSDANKKWAEASESLANARISARDDSERKLTGLEKEFAEIKPKLVKRLSKADYTTVVKDLTEKSDAVRTSIGDLASATADSLEPIKSTVTQRLADFGQAINEAKKRI